MKVISVQSSLLKNFRHGFFTRKGGGSKGIYKGLNCGISSNDDAKTVLSNRNLVAQHMGTYVDNIVGVHQIHSIDSRSSNPNTSIESHSSNNPKPVAASILFGFFTGGLPPPRTPPQGPTHCVGPVGQLGP